MWIDSETLFEEADWLMARIKKTRNPTRLRALCRRLTWIEQELRFRHEELLPPEEDLQFGHPRMN